MRSYSAAKIFLHGLTPRPRRGRRRLVHRKRGETEAPRPIGDELDLSRGSVESEIWIGNVRDAQRAHSALGSERGCRGMPRGGVVEDGVERAGPFGPGKEVV